MNFIASENQTVCGDLKHLDLQRLSAFKQVCQQAALLSKFDRSFTDEERRLVEAAWDYLSIALRNDDTRKDDG